MHTEIAKVLASQASRAGADVELLTIVESQTLRASEVQLRLYRLILVVSYFYLYFSYLRKRKTLPHAFFTNLFCFALGLS